VVTVTPREATWQRQEGWIPEIQRLGSSLSSIREMDEQCISRARLMRHWLVMCP
jgi:hypothetical protein